MPPCVGCQILGDHFCNPEEDSDRTAYVVIHANYAELSACAESHVVFACSFFVSAGMAFGSERKIRLRT